MKKIVSVLSIGLAICLFSLNSNAQSVNKISNAEGATKSKVKVPQEKLNKAEVVKTRQQKTEQTKKIEQYEAKIKANENNPNVDLTKAREELAKMKKEAGTTKEKNDK